MYVRKVPAFVCGGDRGPENLDQGAEVPKSRPSCQNCVNNWSVRRPLPGYGPDMYCSGGSTYKSFRHPPPPKQDQILSFLHMFSPKSACVGGWRPLQ